MKMKLFTSLFLALFLFTTAALSKDATFTRQVRKLHQTPTQRTIPAPTQDYNPANKHPSQMSLGELLSLQQGLLEITRDFDIKTNAYQRKMSKQLSTALSTLAKIAKIADPSLLPTIKSLQKKVFNMKHGMEGLRTNVKILKGIRDILVDVYDVDPEALSVQDAATVSILMEKMSRIVEDISLTFVEAEVFLTNSQAKLDELRISEDS